MWYQFVFFSRAGDDGLAKIIHERKDVSGYEIDSRIPWCALAFTTCPQCGFVALFLSSRLLFFAAVDALFRFIPRGLGCSRLKPVSAVLGLSTESRRTYGSTVLGLRV